MTLNWFSPLPPSPSAVARRTAELLPALARRARVILWTPLPGWSDELERDAEVRRYDPGAMPWTEINAADMTVFHFSNQLEDDISAWRVNQQHPGLVVLHAENFQAFFAGQLRNGSMASEAYLQLMDFHYPIGGREAAEAALRGESISADYSLTGAMIANALGVAVTYPQAMAQLSELADVPVALLPFGANSSTDSLVDGLRALIEETRANEARAAVYWTAGRAGRQMATWFSERTARFFLPRLAAQIKFLGQDIAKPMRAAPPCRTIQNQ